MDIALKLKANSEVFMKKKFQLAALSILLLAVIVAGGWLVLRPQSGEQPGDPDSVEGIGSAQYDPDAFTKIPALLPSQYALARETEADFPIYNPALRELFLYDGQCCTFTLHMDADMADRKGGEWNDGETLQGMEWSGVDVVSATSGQVLCSYGPDAFYRGGNFQSLAMDEEGVLWALYLDFSTFSACIAPCKPEVSDSDVILVDGLAELPGFSDGFDNLFDRNLFQFAAHGGRFYLQVNNNGLAEIDASGSAEIISGKDIVKSFCCDSSGRIFYISSQLNGGSNELVAYSPGESQSSNRLNLDDVQRKTAGFFAPYAVSSADSGCYLWGGYLGDSGYIFYLDPETLVFQEQMALHLDMKDTPAALLDNAWANFAVDGQKRILFNSAAFDYEADDWADWSAVQPLHVLEPAEVTAAPENQISLTITAPYVTDSINNAMRLYNLEHPGVSLVWDVRYNSREEFQANIAEYREQASLRMMVGDIGDLMMLGGSGLDQETVTKTDAFADLSGYLDACPFKDELEPALLEALRGADGAVRAVPLAASPRYLIWNMDLLEELGNPVDPDTVTWSELLTLARQWQEEGMDVSLCSGYEAYGDDPDERAALENNVLLHILNANLYDVDPDSGGPRMDVSHLESVLSQLKELKGTDALYSGSGPKRALFVMPSVDMDFFSIMFRIHMVASDNRINVRLASVPKGETCQKQLGAAFFWGISARSDKKDAAWDFLQFLISRDGLENDVYQLDTLVWNTAAQEDWLDYELELQFSEDDLIKDEMRGYLRDLQAIQKLPYSRLNQPINWSDAAYTPARKYVDGELTIDEAMDLLALNWERFWLE